MSYLYFHKVTALVSGAAGGGRRTCQIDGTTLRDRPILSPADYQEYRDRLLERIKSDGVPVDSIIVDNLCLIATPGMREPAGGLQSPEPSPAFRDLMECRAAIAAERAEREAEERTEPGVPEDAPFYVIQLTAKPGARTISPLWVSSLCDRCKGTPDADGHTDFYPPRVRHESGECPRANKITAIPSEARLFASYESALAEAAEVAKVITWANVGIRADLPDVPPEVPPAGEGEYLGPGPYVVRIGGPGEKCWLAPWEGDPGRTLNRMNAQVFEAREAAEAEIAKIHAYRPKLRMTIEPGGENR